MSEGFGIPDQTAQIDAMINPPEAASEAKQETQEEAPVTESTPSVESVQETQETVEAEKAPETAPEEPIEVKEEPPQPGASSEFELLQAQNAALLEEVQKLAAIPQATPAPSPEQAPTPVGPAEDFITEETLGEYTETAEGLNKLMQKVYAKAVSDATERALLQTSSVVRTMVDHHFKMSKAVDEFYVKNPDLAEVKSYVGYVANQIQAQHPDWTYEQVFGELPKTVRQNLRLFQRKATPATVQTQRAPAFAPVVGNRKTVGGPVSEGKPTVADEIDAMMSFGR